MEKLIRQRLDECHLNFPSYGERSADDIATIARMFVGHLADFNKLEIAAAFDYHVRTKDRFPTVADICGALEPATLYQFDGGPEGFDALYAENHPYVALQRRVGLTDLGKYRVKVRPIDGVDIRQKQLSAKASEFIPIDNGMDLPGADRVGGSGFARLGYDH